MLLRGGVRAPNGESPLPSGMPFVGEFCRSRDLRKELSKSMAVERLAESAVLASPIDTGSAARTPNDSSFERLTRKTSRCRAADKGDPRNGDDEGDDDDVPEIEAPPALCRSKREGGVGDGAGGKSRLSADGRGRVIFL